MAREGPPSGLYPCLPVGTNGQTCYIISVLLKYSLKTCKNRKVPMWRIGSQRTGVGQPLMKRSDLRECLVTGVKTFGVSHRIFHMISEGVFRY
jgi:hypothetical protein